MKKLYFSFFMLLSFLSAGGSHVARADAVTNWNANAGKAAIAACISPADDPLHESRMYAMMHIAIHDALNAIDRRFRPYVYDDKARARVPWLPPSRQRPATSLSRLLAKSLLLFRRRASLTVSRA
jgi:hypothetical protein